MALTAIKLAVPACKIILGIKLIYTAFNSLISFAIAGSLDTRSASSARQLSETQAKQPKAKWLAPEHGLVLQLSYHQH